jgi:hypothetical protein
MIASDVKFIMNGANHLSKSISSYPFLIFGRDWKKRHGWEKLPCKGDTIIGNDVWIGYNATIMPGVKLVMELSLQPMLRLPKTWDLQHCRWKSGSVKLKRFTKETLIN